MFDNIYVFYILLKYKLSLITRLELFGKFREYVKSKGPVFVKLLQIFLLNQYKFGDDFSEEEINELSQILDKVNYHINDADFDVGCGSVAYVYFDKDDRTKVIKKIIPNIEDEIISSTNEFKTICNTAKLLINLPYDEKGIDCYQDLLLNQVNLEKEALNMIKMKNIIEDNYIKVPTVYEYNKDMIKMEYIKGYKLTDFLKKFPEKELECKSLLKCLLENMIENKFIHGDLHEGNFLFNFNEKNNVIVNVIDFGIVFEITDKQKNIFNNYIFNKCKGELKKHNKYLFYYELTNKKIPFEIFKNHYHQYKSKDFFVLLDKFKEINVELDYYLVTFIIGLHNLKVRLDSMK